MKPLIGLNIDINVDKPKEARIARRYYEAVEEGGGIPILVPPMDDKSLKQLLKHRIGVVLIGGRDYGTSLYGGDPNAPHRPVHEDRQEFDLRFCQAALENKRRPVLAICGGMQLLNVVQGGTLIEDIPTQVSGALNHGGAGVHPISLDKKSKLAKIYGATRLPFVITSHHQGVGKLGKKLKRVATSDDGLTEAFEMKGRDFVVGVQYHPEHDYRRELFVEFVRHVKEFAAR